MTAIQVITHVYVSYLEDGSVIKIDNCVDPEYKAFEIEYELVKQIYDSRKDLSKYKIDYFYNLSKGIEEVVHDEMEIKTDMPFVVPITDSYNNEITLEYQTITDCWVLHVRPDVADKIDLVNELRFYITKKDDPHFLVNEFSISLNDEVKLTEHLKDFSLVAVDKIFKSYGVKY